MGCLSYCRKGPASPQFAQSAQWCKQRYCIDLIYPILLLAVLLFALLSAVLPAVSSRWFSVTAPHGLPLFIDGPPRSNFATVGLPAVSSRWLSAAVPLLPSVSSRWCFGAAPHALPLFIGGPLRSNFAAAFLPAVSSPWCFAAAPHGLPVFIGGPIRSNFAAAVLPAVSSRWLSAAVPLASCFRRLPVPAAPPRRPGQQQTSSGGEKYSGLASNLAHLGRIC